MGLFGGTKDKGSAPTGPVRTLRASGMRINVNNPDVVRALAQTRQEWQPDAWGYRDKIGELRFAFQFLARAVSRVQYLAAQVVDDEDDPIPLTADKGLTVPAAIRTAAQEELKRLPLDAGFRFLGVMAENLQVTGECWLHGFMRDGSERWEVLSVDEVSAGQDGRLMIRRYGTAALEDVNLDEEEMLRLWVPHSRFQIIADSPMRALMSVCEEIVLAGREIRAASRSRISSNGILFVPDGMTLLNALKNDRGLLDDASFVADLIAAMMAPIANEGDPGQVAPLVATGTIDDINAVKHVKLERETAADLGDRIDRALSRLARGLDIPPEIISGMSDANHWTAWQIDASTYRYSIDPLVRIVADSLTEAFLRPALLARGFPVDQVKLVQVWYDAGNITENPNRGQDAKDAFDRGAVGFEALRQALGFNPADAPDDEEVLRMVATRIGLDPATAGQLLQHLFAPSQPPVEAINRRVVDPAGADDVPSDGQPKQIGPGTTPPATPSTATPSKPPQLSATAQRIISLIADGAPADDDGADWFVDVEAGRKLMEIDRSIRDQLLTAADGAVTRALEKAGAKVRSKSQKDAQLRAMCASAPSVTDIAALLGPDRVRVQLALSDDELFADALTALEAKFTRLAEAAIERAIYTVLALLRVKKDSDRGKRIAKRLRDGMSGRVASGWGLFRSSLMDLASKYLYNPHPDQEPGEAPDTIVPPSLVRGVLAHVGGAPAGGVDVDTGTTADMAPPAGGIALGGEVSSTLADEGAVTLGFEWAYGITPVRHFEPHLELDGHRFSSWHDAELRPSARYSWVGAWYQPGDHKGCMCDYVPSYAIREYAEVVSAKLGDETPNARADRLLAESDDAAGRSGTTAQLARDERNRIQALQSRYIKAGR